MSAAHATPDAPDVMRLDPATRAGIVEEVLEHVGSRYLFPGVADGVVAAIRQRQAAGEYNGIADPTTLAETLSAHLRDASRDRHLRVLYPAPPRPPGFLGGPLPSGPPTPEELAARRREAVLNNLGVHRVERLPGNVGYLDLRRFYEPDVAGEALVAAMQLVAHTLALIVDLRRNGGGQPGAVLLLCSYLLGPESVHCYDIRWRIGGNGQRHDVNGGAESGERIVQSWTLTYVPGPWYGTDRPVYVLTSHETFSGAEAVAYCLQNRQRATVIGERTGGGAHLSSGIPLRAGFGLSLPTGRAVDPLTGTNWEGTGVAPDVEVPEAEALVVAQAAALRHMLETFGDTGSRPDRALLEEARRTLAELERPASTT